MTTTTSQMNIKTFLNLCTGNWFSQRTNYNMSENVTESGKADLSITAIAPDDSRVTQLCQQHRLEPQASFGGLLYNWDTSVDWGKPKQQGSSFMVFIPDGDSLTEGKLLTNVTPQPGVKSFGTYSLGQDNALTLNIDAGNIIVEERLWFASDNLRLRTTVIKSKTANVTHTTFYSEIRKAPPKES
jgi:phycoerythrin-associated linker protein